MDVPARSARRGLASGLCALSLLMFTGCAGSRHAGSSGAGEALLSFLVRSVAIPAGSDDPYRDQRLIDYPETAHRELDPRH